jgi:AraC-like DNA-binding protein
MNIAHTPSKRPNLDTGRHVVTHARSYRAGTQLGRHVHREAQLLFSSSGVMQVTTPQGRWLVPPQRAVWLPPRFEHAVDVLADIEMRSLYFAPEWLKHCDVLPHLLGEFVVAVQPLLRSLIMALFEEPRAGRRIDLLAQLILTELDAATDLSTFIPMPSDPRARHIAVSILSDPASEKDLGALAREAGVSTRTLTRLFPAETQLTFKQWRQRARIMAAIEMIGSSKHTIKQLAAKLGFSSVAAFSHAFGQIVGMTPTEFRERSAVRQLPC